MCAFARLPRPWLRPRRDQGLSSARPAARAGRPTARRHTPNAQNSTAQGKIVPHTEQRHAPKEGHTQERHFPAHRKVAPVSNSIRKDSIFQARAHATRHPPTLLALCFCRALNTCSVSCLVGSSAMVMVCWARRLLRCGLATVVSVQMH